MAEAFHIRVKLASAFQRGVGEFVEVVTPVATLGELAQLLDQRVPDFADDYDCAYSFSVNGELILHKQRETKIQSGDEIEVLVAFSGG